MEYDESRPYQQGDDIRHLDWRVTARTGRPHTKEFREERELTMLLLLDVIMPGADGVQAGRSFTNTHGQSFGSYRLPDTWNLLGGDPVHGYDAGRTCYNGGAMDGFLRSEDFSVNGPVSALQADPFPLGYFSREQVPFYSAAASTFTIGDRYFVVIFLDGGNDGLNTVTPVANGTSGTLRTAYQAARSTGAGGLQLPAGFGLPT